MLFISAKRPYKLHRLFIVSCTQPAHRLFIVSQSVLGEIVGRREEVGEFLVYIFSILVLDYWYLSCHLCRTRL